jgi:hypothetical protein
MAIGAIALAAFLASTLTFLSGFGLGTVLLPVFALFLPLPPAIAATAVVHLTNNLFKLALVGRHADAGLVVRFGVPACLAALAGAWLLVALARLPAIATWCALAGCRDVEPVKLAVGALLVALALLELCPGYRDLSVPIRFAPLGGLASGFLGGLAGVQGALRAAFLLRAGLGKEAFVATGVAIAVIVDLARLPVYGASLLADAGVLRGEAGGLVAAGMAGAFAGAVLGRRILREATLPAVRVVVAVAMGVVGALLAAGIV